ncbi:hypothetical protein CANTEDRAFT_115540 [Yamadazyma tenuis ATCC 10573]|uniref:Uncharacterized protein n=2 Tax=Candida tenuis TaxID=2315449 RepID=G3BAR3_CANTC|nr:uncharacterized protein CANTEDRAFT_115540 [Yamadazyma tenuis ATCC 10573]EGV62089.1 hypothetical protein CANTEDRAFT_115540 [Yamadazyma tenuis ATCC 10573]
MVSDAETIKAKISELAETELQTKQLVTKINKLTSDLDRKQEDISSLNKDLDWYKSKFEVLKKEVGDEERKKVSEDKISNKNSDQTDKEYGTLESYVGV